ncbi:MAG: hypothetical protein JTT12_07780 [Candidatus Brockarchaeota archaeon]|nr:hypothetical protein [Candidatus Brockarchaeota archaeon]
MPKILERRIISNIIAAVTENVKTPPKSANTDTRPGALSMVIVKSTRSEAKYTVDDRIVLARISVLLPKGRLLT